MKTIVCKDVSSHTNQYLNEQKKQKQYINCGNNIFLRWTDSKHRTFDGNLSLVVSWYLRINSITFDKQIYDSFASSNNVTTCRIAVVSINDVKFNDTIILYIFYFLNNNCL